MSTVITNTYYNIGKVVDILRGSFADISISKIRFLEEEGLIKPERTAGGYRRFSEDDIKRLKSILSLQKDQYMPLSVIKRNMHLVEENAGSSKAGKKLLEEVFYLKEPKKVSYKEASKKSKINKKQINELSKYSIVKIDTSGKSEVSELDVEILNVAATLEKFGIEPRHLKMYDNFVNNEALMIYQVLAPYLKNKKKVEEKVSELTRNLQNLKKLLLKRALLEQFNK